MQPMPTLAQDVIPRAEERPTHVRYWVVVFAVSLAIFPTSIGSLYREPRGRFQRNSGLQGADGLGLLRLRLAYAAFEIPSGYMGDRWGPRRVLMRIVLWWSFFTVATGWAFNFLSLFLTQLLFGAGEAGCFPNITRALATWLPREERVRAQGIIWLSARWGGAFTPLLVVLLFQFVSWRVAFGIFGMSACSGRFSSFAGSVTTRPTTPK